MDRDIELGQRRRQMLKRALPAIVVLVIVIASVVFASDFLKPSVHRARVRFATVERGDFEATVQASGTVVPALRPAKPA